MKSDRVKWKFQRKSINTYGEDSFLRHVFIETCCVASSVLECKGRLQSWRKGVGLQCCDLHNNRSVWMMLKPYPGEDDSLQVVDQSSTEESYLEGALRMKERVSAGKNKQAVWGEHSRRCPRYSHIKPLHTLAHSKNYKCFTVVGFIDYKGESGSRRSKL